MLGDGKSGGTVLHPGTVVAGKYRVERTLAEGGMGLVVAATHLHLEQRVALKFLRGEVSSHQWDALARFSREAKAVAQLRSEHVAHVLDAGVTEEGTPYMVMEYLEGRSLAGVLEAEGALAVAVAAEYAIQACEGLAEAHARGIVHRDIKPYNLFLTERSHGQRSLKIVDFGISKFASSDNVVTGVIVGSPCYMSPEQLRSTASVDHRSDIWSLGATLYELLAGHAAFDSSQTLPELVTAILDMPTPNLREARADVPEGLAAVVTRCLSKDREERFQSAGEVALALLAFAPARAHVVAERAASMKPAFVLPPEEAQTSPEPPSTARSLLPVSNEADAPAEPQTSLGMATIIPNVNDAKQQEGASQALSERRGDAGDDLEMEAGDAAVSGTEMARNRGVRRGRGRRLLHGPRRCAGPGREAWRYDCAGDHARGNALGAPASRFAGPARGPPPRACRARRARYPALRKGDYRRNAGAAKPVSCFVPEGSRGSPHRGNRRWLRGEVSKCDAHVRRGGRAESRPERLAAAPDAPASCQTSRCAAGPETGVDWQATRRSDASRLHGWRGRGRFRGRTNAAPAD